MSKIPKPILDEISIYAAKIRKVRRGVVRGYEERTISGSDLLLCGMKDIDPEKTYIIQVPVEHCVNYEERMKDAYKRKGMEGIWEFLCTVVDPVFHDGLRIQLGLKAIVLQ